jgi:hypothetical protein
MNPVLEEFIKKVGTLEDYGGDRESFSLGLGYFTQGWDAHEEYCATHLAELEANQSAFDDAKKCIGEVERMIAGENYKTARQLLRNYIVAHLHDEK